MEKITAKDVARHLHTTPRKVSAQIEHGVLPIGYVDTSGALRRTVIIPELWERLKTGDLPIGKKRA
jgi:hypothetical protein